MSGASDGKLVFDTMLDVTGLKKGLNVLKDDEIKGLGSAFEKTGGKLTKYVTKPAIAAGAALAGLTLVKGFQRLKSIDDAKAKLTSLGHSADSVTSIMESAMQSVKGTAYGFGDAANIAASAVASGVSEGKDLTRYLSLVGDAASVAGVELSEMGGVFNKIQANGKLSMEEVNQLADKGIPIYKMLSDQLGVTQDQVKSMVSEGKVDCETFYKATEKYMGGAAKENKSFSTTIANVGAALGRIGANFLDGTGDGKGMFSQLKPFFDNLTEYLGKVEDKAGEWGNAFGSAFSTALKVVSAIPGPIKAIGAATAISAGPVLKLTGSFLKARSAVRLFKAEETGASLMSGILTGKLTAQEVIMAKIGVTGKKATSGLTGFVSKIGIGRLGVIGLVAGLVLFIAWMAKTGSSAHEVAEKIEAFTANAVNVINGFADSIPKVIPKVVDAITEIVNVLPKMITSIVGALGEAAPILIPAILSAIVQIIAALGQMLPQLVNPMLGLVNTLFDMLVANLPAMGEKLSAGLMSLSTWLSQNLSTYLPIILAAGIRLFTALATALGQVALTIVTNLPALILTIVTALIACAPTLLSAGKQLFGYLLTAIKSVGSSIVKYGPTLVKNLALAFIKVQYLMYNAGFKLLKRLWAGISSWAGTLYGKVAGVAQRLPKAFKAALTGLGTIGQNFVEGIGKGISGKTEWLCQQIRNLASNAKQAIKNFFHIKSPSRVMRDEVGRYITEGIGVGITDETDNLLAKVRSQAQEVKSAYSSALSGDVTATVGARFARSSSIADGAGTGNVSNVQQTVNFYSETKTPIEVARELKNWSKFGLAGA